MAGDPKWSCTVFGEGSIKWLQGVAGVAVPANTDQPHRVTDCYEFRQAHSPLPYTVCLKKQPQRRHMSEREESKGSTHEWKHVPNNEIKSRIWFKKQQKKKDSFDYFPAWVNVCKPRMGVDVQGFGCCSNAAHRLGKNVCRPWLK